MASLTDCRDSVGSVPVPDLEIFQWKHEINEG
jgi:hypothetical protein